MPAPRAAAPGPRDPWPPGPPTNNASETAATGQLRERDPLLGATSTSSTAAARRKDAPPPPPSLRTDPFPDLEITASSPSPLTQGPHAALSAQSLSQATNVPISNGVNGHGHGHPPVQRRHSRRQSVSSNANSVSSAHDPDAGLYSSAVSDTPDPPSPTQSKSATAPATSLKSRTPSGSNRRDPPENVRKLSASQMQALTSAPDSLPIAIVPPPPNYKPNGGEYPMSASLAETANRPSMAEQLNTSILNNAVAPLPHALGRHASIPNGALSEPQPRHDGARVSHDFRRPGSTRTLSTPPANRRLSASATSLAASAPTGTRRNSFNPTAKPPPLNLGSTTGNGPLTNPSKHPATPKRVTTMSSSNAPDRREPISAPSASSMLPPLPVPPLSLPTHLQLELAGQRPSPLYIHHSQSADMPYESSAVKFERLFNALLLPPYLEQLLWFGTFACLDAWLYTFTILPMRFIIAIGELLRWWGYVIWKETRWVVAFVWEGIWRFWRRTSLGTSPDRETSHASGEADSSRIRPKDPSGSWTRQNNAPAPQNGNAMSSSLDNNSRPNGNGVFHPPKHAMPKSGTLRHRRTKSLPSNLTSYHKADLLQGSIIICSALALMNLDASRMYHFIRAQSSMKLYVIYNILEVGDRLLSAVGQDILECLFSDETLSRNSFGRSKLLLPFGMFVLSLFYNVIHVLCLFYQVITLNVAVNSYSNSLLTLLISNQFVEIKGAVFKKIEKENLFQLTCADVVERFQLWVILLIIGMRNIVEVGGISVPGAGSEMDGVPAGAGPLHTNSILPASFKVLPSWLQSGEVLSPFVVVLGVEMLVDWIKHAYINKFNNVKPTIYARMLDILCKDYYTNAFGTPTLTRRIGLPLIPLSCLFIRASSQIYHMFLSTHLPPPLPTETLDLSVESSTPSSPAMVAALERLDTLIRGALGRAVYGSPDGPSHPRSSWTFSSDDAIALFTMLLFFFLAWIVLLIVKLLLGMVLLHYSRGRYAAMQAREASGNESAGFAQPGKRIGPFGATEVGDNRRKWLYEDDPDGLKRMRDRERKTDEKLKEKGGDDGMSKVVRYEMGASKRIW